MQKINAIMYPAIFVFLLASTCVCTGCSSLPRQGAGAQPDVLAYQEQVTRLEDRVRLYEATTDRTISQLEDIRLRATKTETTIDEVIKLFTDYQRIVEQFVSDYKQVRTETKSDYKQVRTETKRQEQNP